MIILRRSEKVKIALENAVKNSGEEYSRPQKYEKLWNVEV
jgi:hypothetical protein